MWGLKKKTNYRGVLEVKKKSKTGGMLEVKNSDIGGMLEVKSNIEGMLKVEKRSNAGGMVKEVKVPKTLFQSEIFLFLFFKLLYHGFLCILFCSLLNQRNSIIFDLSDTEPILIVPSPMWTCSAERSPYSVGSTTLVSSTLLAPAWMTPVSLLL